MVPEHDRAAVVGDAVGARGRLPPGLAAVEMNSLARPPPLPAGCTSTELLRLLVLGLLHATATNRRHQGGQNDETNCAHVGGPLNCLGGPGRKFPATGETISTIPRNQEKEGF